MSKPCRVVLRDGTVEDDWKVMYRGEGRVTVHKHNKFKTPTTRLFDHWQQGGMARNTSELDQLPKKKKPG